MQLDAFITRTSGLLSRIAASANFSFQSDHAAFNRALISWLKDPDSSLPNGHIIGLCCSSLLSIQFPDESRGSSNDLIPEFRSFVLAASLAHRGRGNSKGSSRQKQPYPARHESRSHLIRRLDSVLTSQYLSGLSSESCQVLFHLVLGAVLGMGHSPSPSTTTTSNSFNFSSSSSAVSPSDLLSSEFQQSPTLWLSTKNQLIRTLGQDLVFLGSNKLGIHLEGSDLEQLIVDTATGRWNEMESRIWVDSIAAEEGVSSAGQEPAQHQHSPSSPSPASPPRHSEPKRRRRQYSFASAASTATATTTGDDDNNQDRNPPYWEDPPPTPPPPTVEPTLIPVMPYQFQFIHSSSTAAPSNTQWSENPTSYLEMTDEPESYYLATANENNKRARATPPPAATPATPATATATEPAATTTTAMPRSMTDPFPLGNPNEDFGSWRKVKRRTMWVVRTIEAGDQGKISVHARLRGREVNDFGVFV
ncbi:hypothetical protein B0T20DRAFT_412539 [Sordaria brevicollis]|uniref:Uncharacterized protein n=1 Tax=Sordaria brevicollis TaxID=83679 RepID=A0AAE0PDI2_SORBR|nr:hypothetical protein B0T20DRAFT_412539 [Sordaria brevicollis]